MRGELVSRFLTGAEQSTVEHLYVHLRSSSVRDRVTFYFHYLNLLLRASCFTGSTSLPDFSGGSPRPSPTSRCSTSTLSASRSMCSMAWPPCAGLLSARVCPL
ncbi:unknown protein [Oryza sativa Japonica Group]|uniref:Os01g0302900 protein n=1 Tax=Oryza sativa subsp. japonica TaxID=39947 RepID=Q657I3_ORYSJ|nr:unknown protein [Oryza sativa Japonica Group]BAF04743.2 Os01g0302900 [Oryza sativa Japonica Group]|eukprot:NP_001042829.2 Os01g0302900 [Oryza sativa Japonica Group]